MDGDSGDEGNDGRKILFMLSGGFVGSAVNESNSMDLSI